MAKKTVLFFLLFLIGFSMLEMGRAIGNVLAAGESTTVAQDFDFEFSHQWDDETQEANQTNFDVNSFVGNLTEADFLAPNLVDYVGTEVPDTALIKYYYRISMTYLWVYKDGDSDGAGELFLHGWINHQMDDEFENTINWTYELGVFNDGESSAFDITLYEGWAYQLHWGIELYDHDTLWDESFGIWMKDHYKPTSSVVWTADFDPYDSSGCNATVQVTVDVLAGPESFTANDLLEAYKPYLFFDVETSYETTATVFGRVIQGYDPRWGKNTTCLQYLFYYPYEYTGTNVFVHNWDWEMMYIYLDVAAGGSTLPYRVVWDNGFYFTASQDWIDGQDYRIFEKNAIAGSYVETVTFSEALWPLLGESRDINYKMENLSQIWTSDMDKWGYFEWGLPTLIATVDTSYHQFDMGRAVPDDINMYRGYTIFDFNTDLIKAAYNSLNYSFGMGSHAINGVYTPNYAPFSWDVSQPFTLPYILNNYPKLVCDITAFNDAKESKKSCFSLDKQIKVTLNCPAKMNMTLPNNLAPGDPVNTELNVFIDQSRAVLTIDIILNITIDIDCFFFTEMWNFIVNETVIFDAATNSITIFGMKFDMSTTEMSTIEIGEQIWNDFMTFSGVISPQLFGQIISTEISVSIYEIVKTFIIDPIATELLDLLVDDFSLTINPIVTGYMQMDIYWGTTLLVNDYQFAQAYSSIPVTITTPSGSSSPWNLAVQNLMYGVNFQVNWSLEFAWATIPSLILDDQTWEVGTWPHIDTTLQEGTATLSTIARYEYNSNQGLWILKNAFNQAITFTSTSSTTSTSDTTPDTINIAGYPIFIIGLVAWIYSGLLLRKYGRNKK